MRLLCFDGCTLSEFVDFLPPPQFVFTMPRDTGRWHVTCGHVVSRGSSRDLTFTNRREGRIAFDLALISTDIERRT